MVFSGTPATSCRRLVLRPPQNWVEVIDNPAAFVDVAKRSRPFTEIDGITATPIDEHGGPTTDCQVVIFDHRPIPVWDPPVDDPIGIQPNMSGNHLSFEGQADWGMRARQRYEFCGSSTTYQQTRRGWKFVCLRRLTHSSFFAL